jgi:hypothetical protein
MAGHYLTIIGHPAVLSAGWTLLVLAAGAPRRRPALGQVWARVMRGRTGPCRHLPRPGLALAALLRQLSASGRPAFSRRLDACRSQQIFSRLI